MTATGYAGKSLDDLLELVENQDYPVTEGFWLAKELRERFQTIKAHGVLEWDKEEKEWVIVNG